MAENNDEENVNISIISDEKKISLISSTLMLAGSIIGTGIFMTPNAVVKAVPSVFYSLLIWVTCGVLSLLAALCYAELGSKFPSLGGEYTYFREVYHEIVCFAYLITNFLLIRPVCISILVIYFAKILLSTIVQNVDDYIGTLKVLSTATILIICIINCLSEKLTIKINDILTYLKFLCMAIVIVLAIIKLSKGEFENIMNPGFNISVTGAAISSALYNGMWAFDGFNMLGYIVEKMVNPRKNLVLASCLGMFLVVFFYLLINFSYLVILGVDDLSKAEDTVLATVQPYFKNYSAIIAIMVALSAFATANSTSYSGGNLYFDAARNGHFPDILAAYHKKYKTYIPALAFQTIITIFYILVVPKMDVLIIYFSGASWVYYSLTFLAVIVARCNGSIRKKLETTGRDNFELPILIPIITFLVGSSIVVLGFLDDWVSALTSISVIFASIPLYYLLVFRGGVIPSAQKDSFEIHDVDDYVKRCKEKSGTVINDDYKEKERDLMINISRKRKGKRTNILDRI